jgi:small subunit ribosomal protein S1|uniref:Ribosomal protein S1 n=1 Tax=Vaucheria litorea TaxID=109269 RepID=B7T1U2_VAULI|nr:ribosomal protein S1 [Vaucheria litorea]ACF70908.1 ribosomal protein S1 [Vaucheria litorea]
MNKLKILKYKQDKIASLLLKYNYQVKTGDILAGFIIGKERNEILLNLGLKKATFLPYSELFINLPQNYNKVLSTSNIGEFIILYYNSQTNITLVSFRRLHYLRLWERFKDINFNNMIFFSFFKKSIWGGKIVKFDKLDIFIPNFHLPKYYRRKLIHNKLINIKILQIQKKQYSIIGSSRLAIFKSHCLSFYKGLVQKCCIIAIKPFGIFLNIYGLRCLLHISEIPNKKIKFINKYYKKGDHIIVKVLYINNNTGKIAVSMK